LGFESKSLRVSFSMQEPATHSRTAAPWPFRLREDFACQLLRRPTLPLALGDFLQRHDHILPPNVADFLVPDKSGKPLKAIVDRRGALLPGHMLLDDCFMI
jgi:hypothetical protein